MTDDIILSREEIVKYVVSTGYLRYWEGALNTAMILKSKQCKYAAALNLDSVIRQYITEVPEDLRKIIGIDTSKLEKQVSEILENPNR